MRLKNLGLLLKAFRPGHDSQRRPGRARATSESALGFQRAQWQASKGARPRVNAVTVAASGCEGGRAGAREEGQGAAGGGGGRAPVATMSAPSTISSSKGGGGFSCA